MVRGIAIGLCALAAHTAPAYAQSPPPADRSGGYAVYRESSDRGVVARVIGRGIDRRIPLGQYDGGLQLDPGRHGRPLLVLVTDGPPLDEPGLYDANVTVIDVLTGDRLRERDLLRGAYDTYSPSAWGRWLVAVDYNHYRWPWEPLLRVHDLYGDRPARTLPLPPAAPCVWSRDCQIYVSSVELRGERLAFVRRVNTVEGETWRLLGMRLDGSELRQYAQGRGDPPFTHLMVGDRALTSITAGTTRTYDWADGRRLRGTVLAACGLRVTLARSTVSGNRGRAVFTVRNLSRRSCRVSRHPRVVLRDKDEHWMGITQIDADDLVETPITRLGPKQRGSFIVAYRARPAACRTAAVAEIDAGPGGKAYEFLPAFTEPGKVTVRPCTRAVRVSRIGPYLPPGAS